MENKTAKIVNVDDRKNQFADVDSATLRTIFINYADAVYETMDLVGKRKGKSDIVNEIDITVEKAPEGFGRFGIFVKYNTEYIGLAVSENKLDGLELQNLNDTLFGNLIDLAQYAKHIKKQLALGNFLDDFIEECYGLDEASKVSPMFYHIYEWKEFLDKAKNEVKSIQQMAFGDDEVSTAFDNISFEVAGFSRAESSFEFGLVVYIKLDEKRGDVPIHVIIPSEDIFLPRNQIFDRILKVLKKCDFRMNKVFEGAEQECFFADERKNAIFMSNAFGILAGYLEASR